MLRRDKRVHNFQLPMLPIIRYHTALYSRRRYKAAPTSREEKIDNLPDLTPLITDDERRVGLLVVKSSSVDSVGDCDGRSVDSDGDCDGRSVCSASFVNCSDVLPIHVCKTKNWMSVTSFMAAPGMGVCYISSPFRIRPSVLGDIVGLGAWSNKMRKKRRIETPNSFRQDVKKYWFTHRW
jgi:hypothetical protein